MGGVLLAGPVLPARVRQAHHPQDRSTSIVVRIIIMIIIMIIINMIVIIIIISSSSSSSSSSIISTSSIVPQECGKPIIHRSLSFPLVLTYVMILLLQPNSSMNDMNSIKFKLLSILDKVHHPQGSEAPIIIIIISIITIYCYYY